MAETGKWISQIQMRGHHKDELLTTVSQLSHCWSGVVLFKSKWWE